MLRSTDVSAPLLESLEAFSLGGHAVCAPSGRRVSQTPSRIGRIGVASARDKQSGGSADDWLPGKRVRIRRGRDGPAVRWLLMAVVIRLLRPPSGDCVSGGGSVV